MRSRQACRVGVGGCNRFHMGKAQIANFRLRLTSQQKVIHRPRAALVTSVWRLSRRSIGRSSEANASLARASVAGRDAPIRIRSVSLRATMNRISLRGADSVDKAKSALREAQSVTSALPPDRPPTAQCPHCDLVTSRLDCPLQSRTRKLHQGRWQSFASG